MAGLTMVRSWQIGDLLFVILAFLFVNVCIGQPMNWNHDQNSGNEVPVVQQQNGHEPSKYLSYNHEYEHPHQSVNFGHQNPNDLLHLSNVGLQQQHDEQRFFDGFQHLNEPHGPKYLSEDQQPFYRGNEVPVVQQQNELDIAKFLRHNQQLEYPHQTGNFGHLNLNQKYGYPDNLLQLSNVGLHQQFDKRSVSQEDQPLNLPHLSRYPREYGQPMSRAYGAPMSRESGTPMSRQYGTPMSRQYGNQGSSFLSARACGCHRNRPQSFLSRSNSAHQGFPEGRWWDD